MNRPIGRPCRVLSGHIFIPTLIDRYVFTSGEVRLTKASKFFHQYFRPLRVAPSQEASITSLSICVPRNFRDWYVREFSYRHLLTALKVIVVLTIFRCRCEFRDSNGPLVMTLHQDGVLFFLCLLGKSNGWARDVIMNGKK